MEATILGFLSDKNLPFRLAGDLVDLCRETSRDTKALNQVALGDTAASYKTVYGVAASMKTEIIKDLQTTPFSLNIDESTSKNDKKVLSILVSYFCQDVGKVVVRHLESVSVVRVTAEELFKVIERIFEENQLPWANLISVLLDSCNVMRGKKSGLETRLREKAPHLVNCDGDTCHHVHNAAKKFSKPFKNTVESLFSDLYTDMKWSVDLAEFFLELCIMFGVKATLPKRYVSHRWLSTYDIAVDTTRLLPVLVAFYYAFVPKAERREFKTDFDEVCSQLSAESKSRLLNIHAALRNKKMTKEGADRKQRICDKLFHVADYVEMVLGLNVGVLPSLKSYTVMFQCEEPSIHKLLDEQEVLLRDFLGQFVRPEVLQGITIKQLVKLKLEGSNLMPQHDIFLGGAARHVRNNRKSATVKMFLEQTVEAYKACGTYLQEKMPLQNDFLKGAQAFDPICHGNSATVKEMEKLAELVPTLVPEDDKMAYSREVRSYNVDKNLAPKDGERIDEWWNAVRQTGKYPKLSHVGLAIASCFHGPQVESAFSVMGDVIDEKSGSLKMETFSAKMTVKYFLRSTGKSSVEYFHRNDVEKTPVDRAMCNSILSSNKNYKDGLQSKIDQLQEKVHSLNAPTPQSAPSKRKYASMLSFVSKRARINHSNQSGGPSTSKV